MSCSRSLLRCQQADQAADPVFDRIVERLSTCDFWNRQRSTLLQRAGNTWDWFLETPAFQEWESGKCHWLIGYGAPGIGKSVLASVIINHLQANSLPNQPVLASYFDHGYYSKINNQYEDFLGSLLQQLIPYRPTLKDALKATLQNHRYGPDPTPHDLLGLLKQELRHKEKTYLVLDALDEWNSDVVEVSRLVSDLQNLGDNIYIFITSRPSSNGEQFQGQLVVELQPPTSDLDIYIRSRLNDQRSPSFLKHDGGLQDKVTRTILDECGGLLV